MSQFEDRLWVPFAPHACSLCRSTQRPTREHKLKASALRHVFGAGRLVVGSGDEPIADYRLAQSHRSQRLKFESVLCEACNTERTQPADRAYDAFLSFIEFEAREGRDPIKAAPSWDGSNLLRYFAKLLACHLSEFGAPSPARLLSFARADSDDNCVWWNLEKDRDYPALASAGLKSVAAHGGLRLSRHVDTGEPTSFCSWRSFGAFRAVFWFQLSEEERTALREFHQEFIEMCQSAPIDLKP